LLFLEHNFRTKNATKQTKGSKVADFRLVFSKTRNKTSLFIGLGPRVRWRNPKKPKPARLWRDPQHLKSKTSHFFNRNCKTSASLEGWDSSLAQSPGELCWGQLLQEKWRKRS